MNKTRIALFVALPAIALLVAAGWFFHGTRTTPGLEVPSSRESDRPSDVPEQLSSMIDASLWNSGLWSMRDSFLAAEPAHRTRLKRDSTQAGVLWNLDFSNLPIGELGSADIGDESEFQVKVHLRGARLCGDSKAMVSDWIRGHATGLNESRCSGADDLATAQTWFRDNFGRHPTASEMSGPAGRRPTAIRVSCSSGDSLRDLARLRSAPPDTLEITTCALGSSEQVGMHFLALKRLVLRDVPDSALELGATRVSREISIEGGNATYLWVPRACPDTTGNCDWKDERLPSGLSIQASRTPLCSPSRTADLVRAGVIITNARCGDYPTTLHLQRQAFLDEWKALVGDDIAAHLRSDYDTLASDSLPDFARGDTTFSEVQSTYDWNGCDESSYPKGFSENRSHFGHGWIDDSQGQFFTAEGIQATAKGKSIRAGMTRAELIALVGRPSLAEASFLAWSVNDGCSGDSPKLRAHFDAQGRLDAWDVDNGGGCGDC